MDTKSEEERIIDNKTYQKANTKTDFTTFLKLQRNRSTMHDIHRHKSMQKPPPAQSIFNKKTFFNFYIPRLTLRNKDTYLKYLSKDIVDVIFLQDQTPNQAQKTLLQKLSEKQTAKTKIKHYYTLLLFLSAIHDLDEDFKILIFYFQKFDFKQFTVRNKALYIQKLKRQVLSQPQFLTNLLKSVFYTREGLVFALILEQHHDLSLFIREREVLRQFLRFGR